MRRLAGDDAADDAIVREHAVFGKRLKSERKTKDSNERDEGYGQRVEERECTVAESARRLDAVADAARDVEFVKTAEVKKTLELDPDLDERLFRAFGAVAAKCASLAKKCAQKNASLLGARNDASKTLAEEMRVDETTVFSNSVRGSNETGHAGHATAALYGSSKLWFAVKKHNAVVWGRALAACEAAEKTARLAVADENDEKKQNTSTRENADDAFASFYRASVVDAHADDLEALRVSGAKHDRSVADVGVLLRAIQSGADVVPALQKALAVQFASLRAFAAEGKRTFTGDEGGSGLDSGSEGDEESEESSESERVERSGSGGSASASEDEGGPDEASDDASDDASSSESASAGGDDEVDYAVTPVAH